MIFCRFYAKPDRNAQPLTKYLGALVACWIDSDNQSKAEIQAHKFIENQGWSVIKLEDSYVINDERYIGEKEGKQYLEQAKIDGEVYVFHPWRETKGDQLI